VEMLIAEEANVEVTVPELHYIIKKEGGKL
jgi:hypothetical protein